MPDEKVKRVNNKKRGGTGNERKRVNVVKREKRGKEERGEEGENGKRGIG